MFEKLKSLAGDALTYGASSMIGQILGFVLLPLYTRHLTPADYGVLAMLALATRLFSVSDLGMPKAVMRFVILEPEERREVIATGLASILVSVSVCLCAALLLAHPIAIGLTGTADVVFETRLALGAGALAAMGALPQSLLRAERRVREIAVINVLTLLVSAGATIWMVVFLGWGVRGMLLGQIAGSSLGVLLFVWRTWSLLEFGFRSTSFRALSGYGLPLLPHRVQSMGLALFGQWVVRHLLGLDEAGLFNVASKFAVPVSFVVGAVQKAWLPFKLEIHAKDEDPAAFFRSAVTYYTAGIAYLALGGAVWFPEVLRWVTPNEFAAAAALIPVLVLIPVGRGMYFMLGTGFEVGRDTKPAPLISFAGVVVVVSLTFLFVPWWGAAGAALATVAAWIVMAYIVYRIAQARYPIRYDWASMAAVGGAAFVLAVGAVFAGRAPMVVRLPVNILITLAFPVGVWWVLVRSSTERERMRRLLRHIPVLKRFMRSSRLAGEKQT